MSVGGSSSRIAKNSLLLYARMLLVMAVTLYTSRIVLRALGVEDYGIYNVVGGVVAMLGFLNGSLTAATSRFLTFELGKGEDDDLNRVFRCSVTVHYLLAALILLLAESVGLWFVLNKLVIPAERLDAALWAYQCSVFTILVSIVSTPYNALIVAHERMEAFAYISVAEVLLKLGVAFAIMQPVGDKLIVYALLLALIQFLVRLLYTVYCSRHFPDVHSRLLWDKEISGKIFSFAGWTMNGNLAVMGYTQGLNILLNLFFGPSVNAARGIAVQVQSAVSQFFNNFLMAVRPQIVKSYAQGDLEYMHKLVIGSSKYAFFLVLLLVVPLMVNMEYVLQLWLGQVPEHSVAFTRLMLLICINYTLSQPTIIGIHATGRIKKFQIIEGTLLLTTVPVAYLFLKFGRISSEMVFVVYWIIEVITQFVRVWIVYPAIRLARRKYLTEILLPIFKVAVPLAAIMWCLWNPLRAGSLTGLIVTSLIALLITGLIEFCVGLSIKERSFVFEKGKKGFLWLQQKI